MEKVLTLPITLSDTAKVLTFASLSILSFFVPFSFGHPQWLVGIIVNSCLLLSAVFLPRSFLLPVIILPSLGILARGLVFGPLTMFLVYFLPFIWISNVVLVYIFKKMINKQYILSGIIASVAKFLFLFAVSNIYFSLYIVPKLFLQTMGFFQLFTALAGVVISYLIYAGFNRRSKRTN